MNSSLDTASYLPMLVTNSEIHWVAMEVPLPWTGKHGRRLRMGATRDCFGHFLIEAGMLTGWIIPSRPEALIVSTGTPKAPSIIKIASTSSQLH